MGSDRLRNRFIDELIAQSAVLESIDEPAAAEAWASGAVAEWIDLGGDSASLATRVIDRAPVAAAMIAWIALGEPPMVGPTWAEEVGRCVVESALRLSSGEEVAIVVGYASPGGSRHDLSISVERGAVVGLSIGPQGLADAVDSGDIEGMEVATLEFDVADEFIRDALTGARLDQLPEASRLNLPLFLRRFGVESEVDALPEPPVSPPVRTRDDAVFAADLMTSALRIDLSEPVPQPVEALASSFVGLLERDDPDATTLLEVAGVRFDPTRRPLDLLFSAVSAYVAPRTLDPHDPAEGLAIAELEWADWLGALLTLVRSGRGTLVDGDSLVTGINRCPEVTTAIPRADAPRIAWAFERTLYAWEVTGVLDEDGRLSEAGAWILPRATIGAWRG